MQLDFYDVVVLIFTLLSTGFHSLFRMTKMYGTTAYAFFQQMLWPFLSPTLVLALALAQFTWMKFSALAQRVNSLTVVEALLPAVLLLTHMQEYDVKVWRKNSYCYGYPKSKYIITIRLHSVCSFL